METRFTMGAVGKQENQQQKTLRILCKDMQKHITDLSVMQVYHWNSSRQIEQYYYDLAKINKAKEQEQ